MKQRINDAQGRKLGDDVNNVARGYGGPNIQVANPEQGAAFVATVHLLKSNPQGEN